MSPEPYEILQSDSPETLAKLVQLAILKSKVPVGGVSVLIHGAYGGNPSLRFYQAVAYPESLLPGTVATLNEFRKFCRQTEHAKR